jgi:uncharacterized protein YceH (UPF0502 family)
VNPETGGFAGVSPLSGTEVRVLGCLLEKQRTTPDAYPLTLNALRLACNQSTNRDPVVEYDDATIRDALHRLQRRGCTRLASGAGSRAAKYRHLLSEALPMAADEQAVVCVLMLRGPQTPGELKQRADRMHAFAQLADVQDTLARLIERGLIRRLERRPGQKEERYTQLLGGADAASDPAAVEESSPMTEPAPSAAPAAPVESAVAALERRVAALEHELAELRAALAPRPRSDPRTMPGHAAVPERPPAQAAHEQAAPEHTAAVQSASEAWS